MKIKMKKYLVGLAIVGLGLFLVACTSGTSKEESKDAAKETKVVKTEMGDVEVPVNPKRVVTNWYTSDVTSLGIIPVAHPDWLTKTMPAYNDLKDVPVIEKWEPEEILSHEPDLIITYSKEDFKKLSKIAPVIVISEDVSSEDRLTKLGEILGREKEAEERIATFEADVKTAKEKLSAPAFKDKTFSIFQDWGRDSYGIYYETASRGGTLLYKILDLKKPEKLEELVETTGNSRESLSYEVAADYFGDYILWFLMEDKESEFAQTEIWKSIPAVKDGRVISIPGEYTGLFFYSDVWSMTDQLNYIIDNLVATVNK